MFCRSATFDRSTINKESRSIRLSFSSDAPILQDIPKLGGAVEEVLDHSAGSVKLERLRRSHPLLFNHEDNFHIGRVEDFALENGKLYGTATFSRSQIGEEKWQDALDGNLTEASIRYRVLQYKPEGKRGNVPRYRATLWEPYECSMVAIPADLSCGIGRSADAVETNTEIMRTLLDPQINAGGGGTATQDAPEALRQQVKKEEREQILKRDNAIRAAASKLSEIYPEQTERIRSMADTAISQDYSADRFNAELLGEIKNFRVAQPSLVGLSDKECKQWSLSRALKDCIENRRQIPGGLEGEVHQDMKNRHLIPSDAQGFQIPPDVIVGPSARSWGQRDAVVGTASQGGNFVQTSIQTPIIEILRNRMVTSRAGVQTLSGLQGNVAIPRQYGAATAYYVSEAGTLTKSTQTIEQVSVSPKRVGVWNNYSKQLVLQSSVDVENFLRDDLMKVLAIKIDNTVLEGTGANTPTGILNIGGALSTVTFGAAATWAKVIAFETALGSANADMGSLAYITTPAVRGVWKAATKTTTGPSFLWENSLPMAYAGPAADYGVGNSIPGTVNGYPAYATKQVSNDLVFYGNFADALLCMWGGLDVVLDPYSIAETATVRIVINSFIDVAVRHGQSFCVSTDTGAAA